MEVRSQRNRLAAIGAGHDARRRYALALGFTLLIALFQAGCCCPGTSEECVAQYNGVSYPDSTFFGHYATCWKPWPPEWVGCPGENGATAVPPGTEAPGAEILPAPTEADSKAPSNTELKTPGEPMQGVVPPLSPPDLPPDLPPGQPSVLPPNGPPQTPPPEQSRRRVPRVSTASFAPPDLPPPPLPASASTLGDTKAGATNRLTPPTSVQSSLPKPQSFDDGPEITGKTGTPLPLPDARPTRPRRTARPRPVKTFTPAG